MNSPASHSSGDVMRRHWVERLDKVARPVLSALARGRLRQLMPVEAVPGREDAQRRFTHLEAFGRTLAGIAPWLELHGLSGEELAAQRTFMELARASLDHATDPGSPDYLEFERGQQPLVDAAFLAHGLLRARTQLWDRLDRRVQENVLRCLRATRVILPGANNWLLFSAMIEAFLAAIGESWDKTRVDYAIRQHAQWYAGDGAYGDGAFFHWDYYNSFVIQPMLLDILRAVEGRTDLWQTFREPMRLRAVRYAVVQERLIAPDGTYPVIGRSIAYRCGAFQALGQIALLDMLPPELPSSQVRCALTAVIRRVLDADGTFDADGWLQIGLCGHQPELAEGYISTGSLYLCLTGLLPLGLSPAHEFWSGADRKWTSQKAWSGQRLPADHAMGD